MLSRQRSVVITLIAWLYILAFGFAFFSSVAEVITLYACGFDASRITPLEDDQGILLIGIIIFIFRNLWLILGIWAGFSLVGLITSIGVLLRRTWARHLFAWVMILVALEKPLFAALFLTMLYTVIKVAKEVYAPQVVFGSFMLLYLLGLFSFNIWVLFKVSSKSHDWEFSSRNHSNQMA